MSKSKINPSIKSILSKSRVTNVKLGLTSKNVNFVPISFRLTNEDKILLCDLAKRLNSLTRNKVSNTKVLQVALQICKNSSNNKILESLREMV
jgi:hypothetical protein